MSATHGPVIAVTMQRLPSTKRQRARTYGKIRSSTYRELTTARCRMEQLSICYSMSGEGLLLAFNCEPRSLWRWDHEGRIVCLLASLPLGKFASQLQ